MAAGTTGRDRVIDSIRSVKLPGPAATVRHHGRGGAWGRAGLGGGPNPRFQRTGRAARCERSGVTGLPLNLTVRLRVGKSHGGADRQRAQRDAAHADNAATGVRGGVARRRPVLGSWGRAAGAVSAAGPA